jgi:hypothetical protein
MGEQKEVTIGRFTCGKCGGSITLASETDLRLKEGEISTITCAEAKTVFPDMSGCDDSLLKLERNKGKRMPINRDVMLKNFPNNESSKAAIAKREKLEEARDPEGEPSEVSEAPDPTTKTSENDSESEKTTPEGSSVPGSEAAPPVNEEKEEADDDSKKD